MDALVTIDFAGGVASTSLVQLFLSQAQLSLSTNRGVSTTVVDFPNLAVGAEQVAVATQSGGVFNGTIALQLAWTGDALPVVTLNNLVVGPHGNPATITWPTAQGPQTQILTPGNPLTLSGIVGD